MIDTDIFKIQGWRNGGREEALNRPYRDIYIIQDLFVQREGAMRDVPVTRTRDDSHRDDGNDSRGGDGYRHNRSLTREQWPL